MLLMSKGSKVVFVAYVHNIDTFNDMLKGSKEVLTVLIIFMSLMLKGSKVVFVAYVHKKKIHSMLC